MTIKVERLRGKASLLRKVASVPTMGAGDTDRILLTLADELDRDAEMQKRDVTSDDKLDR